LDFRDIVAVNCRKQAISRFDLQSGILSVIAILQQLFREIVRLPDQPASNLYRLSPEALDSAGHRVIAIQQIILISFPCGKDIDGHEVVLVSEPIPITKQVAATSTTILRSITSTRALYAESVWVPRLVGENGACTQNPFKTTRIGIVATVADGECEAIRTANPIRIEAAPTDFPVPPLRPKYHPPIFSNSQRQPAKPGNSAM
jgi:hypothetical protein